MVKVPPLGDFTTLSCAAGGVQVSDPLSVALRPPSAVAFAAGFGCDWQAPTSVVAGVATVTVTEPCAGIVPSEQFSTLLVIEQEPWLAEAEVQLRPPLVGRASLNDTLVADAL